MTIDRQLWVTFESEDCTFFILENHYDPSIKLSEEEFADYLTEMEYPVLWIFTVKEGEVMSITEQYLP